MPTCSAPINLKQAGGIVPCGRCFTCRLTKRSKWAFRILCESMLHEHVQWFTLTYEQHLEPREYIDMSSGEVFEASEGDRGTLSPRDVELFIKRLRKSLFPLKFRYFLVGEYGGKSSQPHYHMFLFGVPPEKFHLVRRAWICPQRGKLGLIRLDCADVNRASDGGLHHMAKYTAGYTVKKLSGDEWSQKILRGRYKEFTSHSLGIGRAAVPRIVQALGGLSGLAFVKTFKDVPRVMIYNGRKVVIDRYFREKILEQLGVTDEVQAEGRRKFKKEMLSLSRRAASNPKFKASANITPYVLEEQHKLENAQRVLNMETRAKLLGKKEKI